MRFTPLPLFCPSSESCPPRLQIILIFFIACMAENESTKALGDDFITEEVAQRAPEEGERPRLSITRTSQAPRIDGLLDDGAWSDAPVISEFTQEEPKEGMPATEKTQIRLLYDSNYLYVGIRAYDSEPKRIVAKEMQRDVFLDAEDSVSLTLDTFHDFRTGYYFQINPLGARRDGLISADLENEGYKAEWDGIWYGKSSIDDEGWSAEMAIPMKTVSFDPQNSTWGFNVERSIERKNETVRWTGATRNNQVSSMGVAGELQNLSGLKQGFGLDFIPYANVKARHDSAGGGNNDFELNPGFDLFYKITPAITAALTVNTDFAEAEIDDRRVNLSRFPLFFEEKRDFFLQDATIFRFGGIQQNPLPFHSRKIGLGPDGKPIDIIGGLKVTGRTGPVNFGLLSVQVDETDTLESKNLSVGRASLNIMEQSSVGLLFTNGDPHTNGSNTLLGFDFNYKNSDFRETGQTVQGNIYLQKTFTNGESGDDTALGINLEYPNDKWEWAVFYRRFGKDFNPALGFIAQTGVHDSIAWIGRRWRPDFIDSIYLELFTSQRINLNGEVDSTFWNLPFMFVESNSQDWIGASPLQLGREQIFEPFEITDGVIIPVGDYRTRRFFIDAGTSDHRPLNAQINFSGGEFFDGTRTFIGGTVGWRPSSHFNLEAEYGKNMIRLPHGDFEVNIAVMTLNVLISPSLTWNIVTQWDNVSDTFGLNSRIRWTINPGNDLFLVFNQGVDTSDGSWRPISSEISTKLSWTFRF